MNIPLSIGSYSGKSGSQNGSEMVNVMVNEDTQNGVMPYFLSGTPGLEVFGDSGHIGEGRGGFALSDITLFVTRNKVCKIDNTTGVVVDVDTVDTSRGPVQFAENPTQVMIIDGTNGYVFDKSNQSLSKILDPDFPLPKACAWKDGYGVVVESGTGKFFVSGINDFTSWDALAFTTAEFEPDNLVGCIADHESLFAFGEKSTQAYYNSANADFPFDNRPGANMMLGCGATNSPAVGNNVIFWLDNYGIVNMLAGYVPQTISTRQIEYTISKLPTFEDARGFCYTQEGHSYYLLNFPAAKKTLVFDMMTGQWHERHSGITDGMYRAAWITQTGKNILAGDISNGKIYKLSSDCFKDNGSSRKWYFTLQNVNSDRSNILHDSMEINIESGVGLTSGEDPKIFLQYSDDGGKNWSHEQNRSMGKKGNTIARQKWYNLGRARSRIYRIGSTSPVKTIAISAHLKGRMLSD